MFALQISALIKAFCLAKQGLLRLTTRALSSSNRHHHRLIIANSFSLIHDNVCRVIAYFYELIDSVNVCVFQRKENDFGVCGVANGLLRSLCGLLLCDAGANFVKCS